MKIAELFFDPKFSNIPGFLPITKKFTIDIIETQPMKCNVYMRDEKENRQIFRNCPTLFDLEQQLLSFGNYFKFYPN